MAGRDNKRYDRKDVERILNELGFFRASDASGSVKVGDHVNYQHEIYKDLNIQISRGTTHRFLSENEMSNICSVVMITMHILDMDTSIFKNKEGIEGKFRNAAKRDI